MMTVSQLSRRGGVEPHVVRYYARIGLLVPARHPDNGYKLFSRADISRLQFIRQAQSLGYTLDEIGKILKESGQGKSPCHHARTILRRHIVENRRRLDELVALQARMEHALKQWEKMPDSLPDGNSVCHLIESTGATHQNA